MPLVKSLNSGVQKCRLQLISLLQDSQFAIGCLSTELRDVATPVAFGAPVPTPLQLRTLFNLRYFRMTFY